MAERIIIDPITRIEGHLRIEVEVNTSNVVTDAWSSISLWRGFETILQGRDPRDAGLLTQRFCGVCTYSHYETSILACEDAFGIQPPPNARIIRNLIKASQFLTDHIMHFYHLHGLDWVDVVSALSADPADAVALARSVHPEPYNCSVENYTAVQARLRTFVDSGRLGPFANAYWGNPSYKLSAEANLVIVSHYLDALGLSRTGGQMQAIFGGKNPHPQSLVVGGVTCIQDAMDRDRIFAYLERLRRMRLFIDTAYIPDVLIAADGYRDEGLAGTGSGVTNFLSYGGFPLDDDWTSTLLPKGVVLDGDLANPLPLDETKITEEVIHSWYQGTAALHPYDGETIPDYTGFDGGGTSRGTGSTAGARPPATTASPSR